jgi:peptide-methionine (R)-S-oxide reductase
MQKRNKFLLSDSQWRAKLTPEQYRILREHGTECAFTGPFLSEKRSGTYVCAGCGTALFHSKEKFDSRTGWPSFFSAINKEAVSLHEDNSHGMHRTEICCATCDGHLGHVFPDGPPPSGLRYCTNGLAFEFVADDNSTPASS